MNLSKSQLIILGAVGAIIIFFVLVFSGVIPGLKRDGSRGTEINLVFFGFEEENVFRGLIEQYTAYRPNVKIAYRRFAKADYERELIGALARGQAPDGFMFHSAWLPKHSDKIIPLKESQFSLAKFQQLFPTAAEQDFVLKTVKDNKTSKTIYALPLYLDTLALLYNKDIFDAKGIALPPANWTEFQKLMPELRAIDQSNQIVKAAAAIGGSGKSINSAADLIGLLMMQFASVSTEKPNERSIFTDKSWEAFDFYLQFSRPSSPYYTWNENLRYSADNFAQGGVAIVFNYASEINNLKSKNPYLHLGISPMPQLANAEQPVNYPDYWGLTVSNQSKYSAWAWDFIIFAATQPKAIKSYLEATKLPPALRSLINEYLDNPDLGVFAKQALSARSWQQPDNNIVKQILSNMVESVLNNRLNPRESLEQATTEINSLK